jgi:MerR family transcriptional regulator, mercuric resistance operon regulatory protein
MLFMEKLLTIGQLATLSQVHVETIRFYERKGLIKQPNKRVGFRYYSPDYVKRIQFIKRAQELGFSLKEAQELLNLQVNRQSKCQDVLDLAQVKMNEIDHKIADLKRMKKSLAQLALCCEDPSIQLSCSPVLENFLVKSGDLK